MPCCHREPSATAFGIFHASHLQIDLRQKVYPDQLPGKAQNASRSPIDNVRSPDVDYLQTRSLRGSEGSVKVLGRPVQSQRLAAHGNVDLGVGCE